eukprot:486547_1
MPTSGLHVHQTGCHKANQNIKHNKMKFISNQSNAKVKPHQTPKEPTKRSKQKNRKRKRPKKKRNKHSEKKSSVSRGGHRRSSSGSDTGYGRYYRDHGIRNHNRNYPNHRMNGKRDKSYPRETEFDELKLKIICILF